MGADPGTGLWQCFLIYGQLDRTLIRGEFNGVPQQIDQHLIQPYTVAIYVFRKNFPGSCMELLILGRYLGLHDIDYAVHCLFQRHRLHIQRHFAAFNLGYIQYIVDQSQQVLAR